MRVHFVVLTLALLGVQGDALAQTAPYTCDIIPPGLTLEPYPAELDLNDDATLTWRGAWSSETAYAIDDVVSYPDAGARWIAIAANTNQQPDTNPASWKPVAGWAAWSGEAPLLLGGLDPTCGTCTAPCGFGQECVEGTCQSIQTGPLSNDVHDLPKCAFVGGCSILGDAPVLQPFVYHHIRLNAIAGEPLWILVNLKPNPEICDDGVDNDWDGVIDCADGDCATAPACVGYTGTVVDGVGMLAYTPQIFNCRPGMGTLYATFLSQSGYMDDISRRITDLAEITRITIQKITCPESFEQSVGLLKLSSSTSSPDGNYILLQNPVPTPDWADVPALEIIALDRRVIDQTGLPFHLFAYYVNVQSATYLEVTAPESATAGVPFEVTVSAMIPSNVDDQPDVVDASYWGTVHFTSSDGTAVLPGPVTLTDGVGTFSVTLKDDGSHTIVATDSANADAPITGSSTVSVSPGPATHFALAAPATTTAGSPFDYSVTAWDCCNNVATGYSGTVSYTSSDTNAALPLPATLVSGTGTLSATLTTAGSQTLSAIDSANALITGTSSSIEVAPAAASSFSITAPPSTLAHTPFDVTVVARDPWQNVATTYAGTVAMTSSDALAVLPATSTLTSGVGMFTIALATPGSQNVTATDAVNSLTGTSDTIQVSSPTSTSIRTSLNPSSSGAAVTFTADVTGTGGVPSGVVDFIDSGTVLATAPLSSGSAAATISSLSAGLHSLTASYLGDIGWEPSTSGPIVQEVKPATGNRTATTLRSSLNRSISGEPVKLHAAVSSALEKKVEGEVRFDDESSTLGTVSLDKNGAMLVVYFAAGTHELTATYLGSATADPSVSPEVEHVTTGTLVTLTSSLNPSVSGQAVTFTATVAGTPGPAAPPEGTITFMNDGVVLAVETLVDGTAAFTTSSLEVRLHPIQAFYSGDSENDAATSDILRQVVTGPIED